MRSSLLVLALGLLLSGAPALSGDAAADEAGGKTHLMIEDPASLSGERAEGVYRSIRYQLSADYAESGDPVAIQYQRWRRYNTSPYRSRAHGNQFVNNYVNDTGAAYGAFEEVGVLPAGTMVAKDSFIVTEAGEIKTGSLFLMEKMPPGFAPEDGDWRYMEIAHDGSVVGLSGSRTANAVVFCATCHNKAAKYDRLFFMPKAVRAN